jgi:hypothetical protein
MKKSHPDGQEGPPAPAFPPADLDAERHVARLTGMTPEAAHAFVAFHSGRLMFAPRRD